MNNILSLRGGAQKIDDLSLEELMLELTKYGRPRLSQQNKGTWHCCVDMRTGVKGADFEIKSEFRHKTMMEAAHVCLERVLKAVATINEGKI